MADFSRKSCLHAKGQRLHALQHRIVYFDLAFVANKCRKRLIFSFKLSKLHEGIKVWSWGISPKMFLIKIKGRALRALASSSRRAVCSGATRSQPQESTPGVRGDSKVIQAKEKICDGRTDTCTEGHWTDRRDGGNSYLDVMEETKIRRIRSTEL